jgi:Ser/Thr protein kinase RdoA (MazF antagonist)
LRCCERWSPARRRCWTAPAIKNLVRADLARLPEGNAICHWDFHPGNVIETPDGPKVIDWLSAKRGNRLADVARTLLIIRGGALGPGTPFLVRTLTAFGRSVLSRQYLHEYRRICPFDSPDLEGWRLISAASRLSYGIPQEREYLLGMLALGRKRPA